METKSAYEIRKYSPDNYEKTIEWLNDKEMKKLFGITYDVTLESHSHWIANNSSIEFLPLYFENEYVGNIVLSFSPRHKSAYLQIYIGSKQYRGKGLGKNFMLLAMDYVFNVKKDHRIWLHVREYNESAIKLYTKLGFKDEGLERESVWDGETFLSQKRMSILSREFIKESYEVF